MVSRLLLLLLISLLPLNAFGGKRFIGYDIGMPPDSVTMSNLDRVSFDSTLSVHPMFGSQVVYSDVQTPRFEDSKTMDFYLLLLLCIVLGVVRFVDERYFLNLWTAFWNPTLSNRQLKDQIQSAGLPEVMMNLFFSVVVGTYLFYVVRWFIPHTADGLGSGLFVLLLIAGVAVIYGAKYTAVRFSGWAFRMEATTEHYLFNVFLINKILSMVLLPFVIVLAFADKNVTGQILYISASLGGLLIINRYLRSWQLFGTFFQNSRFHFFMYLCASELLPLAVLIKFFIKSL
jgi:hypothetical protein